MEMSILVNVEIVFSEAGDDALLVVDDRGMQHDFFDVLSENENAAVGGIRILSAVRRDVRSCNLPRGGWRRCGAGRWRLDRGLGIRR